MKSIVQDRYGPTPEDVLRLAEIETPTIRPDEVLVRVHAASVDRGTWHVMAGLPYPIRMAGFGLRRPKSANPGRALAGTVHIVGAGVTGFKPGDEVFGIGSGSFAEYAHARPDKLWLGGIDRQLRAHALSPFVGQNLGTFVASENSADLTAIRELIESGKVTPAIDRSYPLNEAAAAIRHMLDGRTCGKVVITI
ncbi:zinc-binding dehydrogenase [Streptomyces silvisoli]|uniref:Zinc-binding dehydrogenase n=1 Tax=Streptomyces silvisoli TaxID=3034235 RepID=A0ABT5ZD49_9ACTN|nr:zinc-binding dehydrogenase [Streptomyces silvisoli]MDF3287746.1 zinc-binding dehydrogenase [Streptomyces silvisoli]